MFLSSHSVNSIGQEILCDQSDADMRSNSEVKGGESDPQLANSLVNNSLFHCVEDVFIWELSVGVFLHFLDFSFCVIKGQADKRREEA